MTTTNRELATRFDQHNWSLAALSRRIDLAKASGWGLQNATQSQLNTLALYCQKRELLPGDEVTLYDGLPFITVDGRVTLMRREHRDDYRGFAQRPLSHAEKEDWGYAPDDLVVETTIRSVSMGEVKAHGKVSADERSGVAEKGHRINPVARFNPVEMAQNRSLKRAQRFAYGFDSHVDEEAFEGTAHLAIEERNDPERVKTNAQRHTEIFGSEDDVQDPIGAAARRALNAAGHVVDVGTGEVLEHRKGGESPTEDKKDGPAQQVSPPPAPAERRMARLQTLLNMAKRRGLVTVAQLQPTSDEQPIDAAIEYWEQRITNHDLDQQAAKASQA